MYEEWVNYNAIKSYLEDPSNGKCETNCKFLAKTIVNNMLSLSKDKRQQEELKGLLGKLDDLFSPLNDFEENYFEKSSNISISDFSSFSNDESEMEASIPRLMSRGFRQTASSTADTVEEPLNILNQCDDREDSLNAFKTPPLTPTYHDKSRKLQENIGREEKLFEPSLLGKRNNSNHENMVRQILWYNNHHDSHKITPFFTGYHQLFEIILHFIGIYLNKIEVQMKDPEMLHPPLPHFKTIMIANMLTPVIDGWRTLSSIYEIMTTLDRASYLDYIMRVNGVSGGNSPQMIPITSKTYALEKLILSEENGFSDEMITNVFSKEMRNESTAEKVANRFDSTARETLYIICQRLLDTHDAVSRTWMGHVVTATTVIGITKGTQGTPNEKLVERVITSLYRSRLLTLLGAARVHIEGIGCEIQNGVELCEYPFGKHYLDFFNADVPHFGTHSQGKVTIQWRKARLKYSADQIDLGEYYGNILPSFKKQILASLGIDKMNDIPTLSHEVAVGHNCTEFIDRIITSVKPKEICIYKDEFLASIRRTYYESFEGHTSIKEIIYGPACEDISNLYENISSDLVILSVVNSLTQVTLSEREIKSIILNVMKNNPKAVILIDIAQAYFNVPTDWNDIFSNSEIRSYVSNIFLVGSMIKHARLGDGLGFLIYSNTNPIKPASGWIAYLNGLRDNATVDCSESTLLYCEDLRWEGGTTGNTLAVQVAHEVLPQMPSLDCQYTYVQGLIQKFLSKTHHQPVDVNRRQNPSLHTPMNDDSNNAVNRDSAKSIHGSSNTVCLRIEKSKIDECMTKIKDAGLTGIDYKVVDGYCWLRIGFGIHNLPKDVTLLVNTLESISCVMP